MSNLKSNLAEGFLFTDQYQLTMAQVYFLQNIHETEVRFEHFFRNYPDYGSHQILVATKAARIKYAARGRPVLEFGLRRAHGFGGNAGGRAALIGGADFSSNVGLSHTLGYPPKGTHAHSMIQVFKALGMDEVEAFRAFAEAYPDNCILLVDTVDTLGSGIPNAIKVFQELRRQGYEPKGIRLDSGDLAYLAVEASLMLNQAGFLDVSIVLSNDLDELKIQRKSGQKPGSCWKSCRQRIFPKLSSVL